MLRPEELSDARLLEFVRRLHAASDFPGLIRELSREVKEALGYQNTWVTVLTPDAKAFRILTASGPAEETLIAHSVHVPIDGDPYMERVLHAAGPEVVVDAQSDPLVNRKLVERIGIRTVINVPLRLIDEPLGTFGAGTFGEEGPRPPTEAQLSYMAALANHVVVASARLQLTQEREEQARQRVEMERLLAQRQRLESLAQLAGGVAHDFNNLLTVILASAVSLREEGLSPNGEDELRMIMESAQRAAELTARLLAFGQRQPLQFETVDPSSLLQSVVSMLRRVLPTSIAVDLIEGRMLSPILADKHQIEQVLMNICLNAWDAMPNGGRLTVETEQVVINGEFVRVHPWAQAGRYVLISITDTGTGIDRELLNRIFEPFFTTKVEGRSSGLGLAVCRGIVEQHGGLLHAYSEPGMGSTFKVYLPLSERSARDVGHKLNGPIPSGHEKILVADDQEYVRRVIERILKRAGYQVVAVSNGSEAVRRASSEAFDLIILDAVMPEMGGREAYTHIRALCPDVPVLFASGYGAEEVTTRFLQDMRVPLLPKPFDPDTLLRTVRQLLSRTPKRLEDG